MAASLYEITVLDAERKPVALSQYKGKVLLIVNTATGCGFTPQYNGLQVLYEKYRDQDFEILDFPCNQFGNQAPGSNEEIASFCQLQYDITFKQFDKIEVNGKNENPLFNFLKSKQKGTLGTNIKWNFTKFLVNRQGEVVARYAPAKKPEAIEQDIVKLLQSGE